MGEPASSFPFPILREVMPMNEQLESVGGGSCPNELTEGSPSELVTPMSGGIVGEGNSNHPAWSSETVHPLQNPVILTHLFELCPSGLLSKFRLVSREWHRLSLAPWRSSFPLTVLRRCDDSIYVNSYENNKANCPLGQFMDHLQNPANDCDTKPFRQLRIEFFSFRGLLVPQAGWNILGQGVTKLTLHYCTFNGIRELCELLQELFPNLRSLSLMRCLIRSPGEYNEQEPVNGGHLNLKSLSVEDWQYQNERPYNDWSKFVSNFPSLTHLAFYINKDDKTVIERVLHVITTIKRIDESKFPIKGLSLRPRLEISNDPVSLERVVLCQQLRLPLQAIRIRLYPNLEETVIEEILRFHGGSLQKITALEDRSNPSPSCWKFPFNVGMEKLQKLKISASLLESLQFLKYTPNLGRLYILDEHYDVNRFKHIRNTGTTIVSNTLKHSLKGLELSRLTVFHLYYVVSDDDLRCLIKWMPNVNDLSMVLNDAQFGMICDGWRHLKKLEVQGPELTDVGVTGISRQERDQYHLGVGTRGNMSAAEGIISPNITLLRDLQQFEPWSSNLTAVCLPFFPCYSDHSDEW